MRKNILVILMLVACLATADTQRLYRGTLSPLERLSLEMNDHEFSFVLRHSAAVSWAKGTYVQEEGTITLKTREVEFGGQGDRDPAAGFAVEVRRKGVDTPPPTVWFIPGKEFTFQARREKDQLTLSGPEGWEITLFAE